MTSMVSGRLEAETSLTDILKALFPCGSITGAPKLNTMSYIKALEANPRYIYCGTIGLLCPDDKMIFNIPIRTLEYRNEKVTVWVQGLRLILYLKKYKSFEIKQRYWRCYK